VALGVLLELALEGPALASLGLELEPVGAFARRLLLGLGAALLGALEQGSPGLGRIGAAVERRPDKALDVGAQLVALGGRQEARPAGVPEREPAAGFGAFG